MNNVTTVERWGKEAGMSVTTIVIIKTMNSTFAVKKDFTTIQEFETVEAARERATSLVPTTGCATLEDYTNKTIVSFKNGVAGRAYAGSLNADGVGSAWVWEPIAEDNGATETKTQRAVWIDDIDEVSLDHFEFGDNGGDPDGNAWLAVIETPEQRNEARRIATQGLGRIVNVRVLSARTVANGFGLEIDDSDTHAWNDSLQVVFDRLYTESAVWAYYSADDMFIVVC